jgi:hypothetical protein
MRVLHLVKSAAYYGMAICYWAMLQGHHGPVVFGSLCILYLVLCALEAAQVH